MAHEMSAEAVLRWLDLPSSGNDGDRFTYDLAMSWLAQREEITRILAKLRHCESDRDELQNEVYRHRSPADRRA